MYAGTAAPFNFNGLVRHYFMRRGAERGRRAGEPAAQGRARRGRATPSRWRCGPAVDSIARRYGARAKVAEIPPGPPVLSTLVAEVYAADDCDAARGGDAGARRSSSRRRAWWTWTGPSRRRRRKRVVPRGPGARRRGGRERGADRRRRCTWRSRARRPGWPASPTAREGVAIVPRLAARDRASASRRCWRCRWRRRGARSRWRGSSRWTPRTREPRRGSARTCGR